MVALPQQAISDKLSATQKRSIIEPTIIEQNGDQADPAYVDELKRCAKGARSRGASQVIRSISSSGKTEL